VSMVLDHLISGRVDECFLGLDKCGVQECPVSFVDFVPTETRPHSAGGQHDHDVIVKSIAVS
jgi:hypothetical protein